jgi:excisionase family DNA binding protein
MTRKKPRARLSDVNGGKRFASIPEAAEEWDVHPATVRKWLATGLIRSYRSGPRLIRVDMKEIETMMAGETA